MAKVKDNVITEGLSGKLGKRLVFRRGRGGTTIVGVKPVPSENPQYSEAQLAQQEAFKTAAEYAKKAKTQPVYKALTRDTEATAYNQAVADWFGQPRVLNINASGWTGQTGQTIEIKAIDDTKVVGVRVVIHNNGTILEEGEALPSETDGLLWTYVTTTDVAAAPGILLDANARDMAGNIGAASVPMD